MTNTFLGFISLDSEFPTYLYQVEDEKFTAVNPRSPLSTWVCADCEIGVYEYCGKPMICGPKQFVRDDRGDWYMSDEDLPEYAM